MDSSEAAPLLGGSVSTTLPPALAAATANHADADDFDMVGSPLLAHPKNYSFSHFISEVSAGVINTVICVPVTFGFTAIIYSHEIFTLPRPNLVRLIMWSSIVHQTCMTLFSSMNFSIGQVQDAGLIFLSAIAVKMANNVLAHYPEVVDLATAPANVISEAVSTSVIAIAFYTLMLGVALQLIAYFRLAKIVTYLPLSVLSAYLAYIGLFCGMAGLSVSNSDGISLTKPYDIIILFTEHTYAALFAFPSLFLGAFLMYAIRRWPHPLTLPSLLMVIPFIFHIVRILCGWSLDDARNLGLMAQPQDSTLAKAFDYISFSGIHFSAIPTAFFEWVMLVFVVAFSSSLDIIAIEIEIARPLDIDAELRCIGVSNAVSGGLLGYTGSYIFSQTIFTSRTRPTTRLPGVVVILLELTALLSPVDFTAYIPRVWFGTPLCFVALELLSDWLIQQGRLRRVQASEYLITVLTFFAILFTNIQIGLCIGMLISLSFFVISFGRHMKYSQNNFYSSDIPIKFNPPLAAIIYGPDNNSNVHQDAPMRFPLSSSRTASSRHSATSAAVGVDAASGNSQINNELIEASHCTDIAKDHIRYYLIQAIHIVEVRGHFRFMNCPRLLDFIQDIVYNHRVIMTSNRLRGIPRHLIGTPALQACLPTNQIYIPAFPLDGPSSLHSARQRNQYQQQASPCETVVSSSPSAMCAGIAANSSPSIATSVPSTNPSVATLAGYFPPTLEQVFNNILVLNFSRLGGIDSSAVRTIKLIMNTCVQFNFDQQRIPFDMLLVGVAPDVQGLIARNGISLFYASSLRSSQQLTDSSDLYPSDPKYLLSLPSLPTFPSIEQACAICNIANTGTVISASPPSSYNTFATLDETESEFDAEGLLTTEPTRDPLASPTSPAPPTASSTSPLVPFNTPAMIQKAQRSFEQQRDIARMFGLDPATIPIFVSPVQFYTHAVMFENTPPPPAHFTTHTIICAHFDKLEEAKLWIAAKAYFMFGTTQ